MAQVLIIDDEKMVGNMLTLLVRQLGHRAVVARSLKEGLERCAAQSFDLVLLDIFLPDGNGLAAIPCFREVPPYPEVIIITSKGDPDGAELAIKNGAWDFIEKPCSVEKMTMPILRALQYCSEKQFRKSPVLFRGKGLVGESLAMKVALSSLLQAAGSSISVLLTGESGTGKELFAQVIHNHSARAAKNMVVVDCASLPETIIESVLFGHEKGAFTGADRRYEGLIRQADGGSLFLDEVAEMSLSLQKSFLRVLQEHRFRSLGGKQETSSDFRLIAATHQDLQQLVREGRFREDLFFRIRALTIELPPLRERPEDIKDLFVFYLDKLTAKNDQGIKGYAPEFLEAFLKYDWPGNVRELVQAVEFALAKAGDDPILYPIHLPPHIRVRLAQGARSGSDGSGMTVRIPKELSDLSAFREIMDKVYFQRLVSLYRHNEAQKISGLSRSHFYALLRKHNLLPPDELAQ